VGPLLDDRFEPITSEIGFIELPAPDAADAYAAWQERIEAEPFEPPELDGVVTETYYGPDVPPEPRPLPADEPVFDTFECDGLEGALARLPPLSVSPRRYAFVATESAWTAYFDNGWGGTDAFPPMSYLAYELGCRALRVVARSDAALLGLYGPRETEWLNVERAVGAIRDGDRWTFVDQGQRLPFEDETRYQARRIRDRFTLATLEEYTAVVGVRPLDETFYAAPGIVLERRRAPFRDERELSLEEARAAEGAPPPLAVPHRPSSFGLLRGLLRGRR
jgi:hypothetical protein